MREFIQVRPEELEKYNLDAFTLPKRATKHSAGYDFIATQRVTLYPHEVYMFPTGVKARMEKDEVLKIYIRSSLAMKKGIVLANEVGIIDADYADNPDNDGHIFIGLLSNRHNPYTINAGDKIAQGIFQKYLITDSDDTNDERVGGIGSTSRS